MILLALNMSLEKIMLFRCCQIDHVNASHQHFHLLTFTTTCSANGDNNKYGLGMATVVEEVFPEGEIVSAANFMDDIQGSVVQTQQQDT